MSKRLDNFYSDFETFITEVTLEMNKRDQLTAAWLKAIGSILGNHFLAKMLIQNLMIDLPIIIPGIGTLSTGTWLQTVIDDKIAKYQRPRSLSEEEEKIRLKKAKVIFQEFIFDHPKKVVIDALFEDLVAGEEIIY